MAALAAYFAGSRDIGDIEVLEELAVEAGLDPAALRTALNAGAYAGAREAARAQAHSLGVTAVPTYIFAGEARVIGAQPLDQFRRLLVDLLPEGHVDL